MVVKKKPVGSVAVRTPETEIVRSLANKFPTNPFFNRKWVRGCGTWCSISKEQWVSDRRKHQGILIYSGVENPEQDLTPTTDTFVQLKTQNGPLYLLLKEAT